MVSLHLSHSHLRVWRAEPWWGVWLSHKCLRLNKLWFGRGSPSACGASRWMMLSRRRCGAWTGAEHGPVFQMNRATCCGMLRPRYSSPSAWRSPWRGRTCLHSSRWHDAKEKPLSQCRWEASLGGLHSVASPPGCAPRVLLWLSGADLPKTGLITCLGSERAFLRSPAGTRHFSCFFCLKQKLILLPLNVLENGVLWKYWLRLSNLG